MVAVWTEAEKNTLENIYLETAILSEIADKYRTFCYKNRWPQRTNEGLRNQLKKKNHTLLSTRWTKPEIAALKEIHAETISVEEITKRLSVQTKLNGWMPRSRESVRLRCNKLKLALEVHPKWSEQEIEFVTLQHELGKIPEAIHRAYRVRVVRDNWAERSLASIKHRVNKLKGQTSDVGEWTKKEIDYWLKCIKETNSFEEAVSLYQRTIKRKKMPLRNRYSLEIEARKHGIKTPKSPRWTEYELAELRDILSEWPKIVAVPKYIRTAKRNGWPTRSEYSVRGKINNHFKGVGFHREDNLSLLEIANMFDITYARIKDWVRRDGLMHTKVENTIRTEGATQRYSCIVKKKDLKDFLLANMHRVYDVDDIALEWVIGDWVDNRELLEGKRFGAIPVVKTDLAGIEIKRYASISEAARRNFVSMDCVRNHVHSGKPFEDVKYYNAEEFDERREKAANRLLRSHSLVAGG